MRSTQRLGERSIVCLLHGVSSWRESLGPALPGGAWLASLEVREEAPLSMRLVTLYTKTYCGYSKRAKEFLSERGVEFDDIDVTEDGSRFAEMVKRSGGRTTVPQIFIADRHVGGFTELVSLQESGELDALLGTEGTASSPS